MKLSHNLSHRFSNWITELKLRDKHSDMLLSFFNPAFMHTWCTLVNCCLVSKLFNIFLNFTNDFKPDYFSPLAFIVLYRRSRTWRLFLFCKMAENGRILCLKLRLVRQLETNCNSIIHQEMDTLSRKGYCVNCAWRFIDQGNGLQTDTLFLRTCTK